MIQVSAQRSVRTSRETVWRHLTRVSDWPRWFPGLHGVSEDVLVAGNGARWNSAGQMGRLLYRSGNEVIAYRMLESMSIQGDRRPWIRELTVNFALQPDGPYCRLNVSMSAKVRYGVVGRFLLERAVRSRLEVEVQQICERLAAYAEELLPHQ